MNNMDVRKKSKPKHMCNCLLCENLRVHAGRGLCSTCYSRELKRPGFEAKWKRKILKPDAKFVCRDCKLECKHYGKGLCTRCYSRVYMRLVARSRIQQKIINDSRKAVENQLRCVGCMQFKLLNSKGMCGMCYQLGFNQAMYSDNKENHTTQSIINLMDVQQNFNVSLNPSQQYGVVNLPTNPLFDQPVFLSHLNPKRAELEEILLSSGDEDEQYC
ncbi:hypothetical protein M3Y97_01119400 [Aphelenchoides bicaudatus]|nr:hypothetical protein M3Y97_01119400 [Aphelenchoides bicaudatus]